MAKESVLESTVPCNECGGLCCKYLATEIDTPTCKRDYDNIRWYLLHKGVSVFRDDGVWHVEFDGPCEALDENGHCSNYANRPLICREHGEEQEACDFFPPLHELLFTNTNEFEQWLEQNNRDWRWKQSQSSNASP